VAADASVAHADGDEDGVLPWFASCREMKLDPPKLTTSPWE
jgi:hypothetical protein